MRADQWLQKLDGVLKCPLFDRAQDAGNARYLLDAAIQQYRRERSVDDKRKQVSAINQRLLEIDSDRARAKWLASVGCGAVSSSCESERLHLRQRLRSLKDDLSRLAEVRS